MNEVLRKEKKFFINIADRARFSAKLGTVMRKDTHGGDIGYSIRSLYFDTIDNADYFEKLDGMETRRKIRLRVYDADKKDVQFAMLEMKQKQGDYQKKRSLRIERDDAEKLAMGQYSCLLSYRYTDSFAAECFAILNERCYMPKTIVEYKRTAFIADENRIRITFDSDIRASESFSKMFSSDLPLYPVLDPFNCVLEVKYNGFLLSYIKEILKAVNASETSVSKYYLSRCTAFNL